MTPESQQRSFREVKEGEEQINLSKSPSERHRWINSAVLSRVSTCTTLLSVMHFEHKGLNCVLWIRQSEIMQQQQLNSSPSNLRATTYNVCSNHMLASSCNQSVANSSKGKQPFRPNKVGRQGETRVHNLQQKQAPQGDCSSFRLRGTVRTITFLEW